LSCFCQIDPPARPKYAVPAGYLAAMPDLHHIPTQQQLMLPLLRALQQNGPMPTGDAIEAVAETFGLSRAQRAASITYSGSRRAKIFDRTLRWTRHNAVIAGLMPKGPTGLWQLADKGRQGLLLARPGTVICVARDDEGAILWARAQDAVAFFEQETFQLIFESPPYPLVSNRAYATSEWSLDHYLDTLVKHVALVEPLLVSDGSLILNLGDAYKPGAPSLNLYQEHFAVTMETLGWHLCGRSFWHSPNKPKTTPWVTQTRERQATSVEALWWWARTPHPYADNRSVLQPYSERHLQTIARGGELRTKPHEGFRQSSPGQRYRADCGGSIPQNLISCGSEGPRSQYMRFCRDHGLPHHPARMPARLAEHFISLTTRPGDAVFDAFAGSLIIPAAARKLGRRSYGCDQVLQYLEGGIGGRIQNGPIPMETCFDLHRSGHRPTTERSF
jgi:site-specific DNA-methyltransferase (cytosine-N4-specific)